MTVEQLLRWKTPRIPKLEEWQRGYIAGIIEGDGSISIAYDKGGEGATPHYRPSVYVVNTDPRILQHIGDILRIPKRLRLPQPRHLGNKPLSTYTIQSLVDVKFLVEQILPYLSGKKDRAELMLKFVTYKLAKKSSIGITPEETGMYVRMKELNA